MSRSEREREELDMAVPASFDAINDYYRENMKNILNNSSSSIASMSSIDSIERRKSEPAIDHEDDGSSTASDSDLEDCANFRKKTQTDQAIDAVKVSDNNCSMSALSNSTATASDNLQNRLQNINSVSINNSSDVHFGNKTFYNGPVTIKQIVLNDDYLKKKDEANGTINRAFEGSSNEINIRNIASDRSNDDTVQNVGDSESGRKFVIARKKITLFLLATAFGLVAVLSLLFVILEFNEDDDPPRIVTRDEWQAVRPKEALTKLELPVNRIIIAHTVTNECFSEESCAEIVRKIQIMHMTDKAFNFSDIAYNYIIGGDGSIFEGRGWKDQGAHTSGYNRGSIGIAYIGTFINKVPSDMQFKAGFRLFREGVRVGALKDDYKIYGAKQLRSTQSPGDAFFEKIKTWKHWSEIIV